MILLFDADAIRTPPISGVLRQALDRTRRIAGPLRVVMVIDEGDV